MFSRPSRFGAVFLMALAATTIARADELALLPTIGFLWAPHGGSVTAELFLAPGMRVVPDIVELRSTASGVEVTGFELLPESGQLLLDLRLTRDRSADVDSIAVAYRATPATETVLGALRVVPATAGTAGLRWARADTAADIGVVYAGALVNEGSEPITVRAVRYAPDAIGQGLVLVETGVLEAFNAWSDAVMGAAAEARWPEIQPSTDPHLRSASGTTPAPRLETEVPGTSAAEYRIALSDALPASRWADAGSMSIEVPPGEALFVAITVASFRFDIAGLALAISPVAAVEHHGACCLQVGSSIPAVTRGDLPF